MHQYKTLILNYTGNRSNWGCCATSDGLLGMISKFSNDIDTIPLLDHDEYDEILDVLEGKFLNRILLKDDLSKSDERKILKVAKERFGSNCLEKVRRADVVIFQAEGTMTGQSFYAGIRLLLLPFIAKKIFGKIVLSLNQTVFSAQSNFIPVIRHVFQQFDLVALREEASYQFTQQIGLSKSILIPDAAFLTQYQGLELPDQLKPLKYFTITGAAKIEQLPIDIYCHSIHKISLKHNLKPVFLLSTSADIKILSHYQATFSKDCLYFDQSVSYNLVTKIISASKFLIGGRYHMCCLSALSGIPYIPLASNTFKNEGLNLLLSYPLEVLDVVDSQENILSSADKLMADYDYYKNLIIQGMSTIKKRLYLGEIFIAKVFELEVIRSETVDRLLAEPMFSSFFPKKKVLSISDARWDYFYRLNRHAPWAKNSREENHFFKNIPILFSILRWLKYKIKRMLYAQKSK